MLQNSTNRLNGQGWGYTQWYHDCLAGIRAWVVEFLVLKIIRTIAAGRADSRESKWYPVIPPNLRTPFRTKVLEVRGLYKMML